MDTSKLKVKVPQAVDVQQAIREARKRQVISDLFGCTGAVLAVIGVAVGLTMPEGGYPGYIFIAVGLCLAMPYFLIRVYYSGIPLPCTDGIDKQDVDKFRAASERYPELQPFLDEIREYGRLPVASELWDLEKYVTEREEADLLESFLSGGPTRSSSTGPSVTA